ncbi:hypothetical protein SLE2022_384850 [Rubroshorea leprosula]
MVTKTLVRSGASLFSRLTSSPLLNTSTSSNHRIASEGLRITPQLFPSLSKPQTQTSLHFPQEDSESISKVSSLGFLYPTGLPSVRFFLPDGDSSDEPMLLFPKRTYQPRHIRRKRTHGFFARKATKGGQKVIARRIAKGRARITA